MAAAEQDVRRELRAERQRLAEAVDLLRSELGATRKRGARLALAGGGLFALGAAARLLLRGRSDDD
jgi:hypothetical protein